MLIMKIFQFAVLLVLIPLSASARNEAQQQFRNQFVGAGFESLNRFCDLPKTCMGIAPDKTSHRRVEVGDDHHLVDIYNQTYVYAGLVLNYSIPVSKVKVGRSASNLDSPSVSVPRFRQILVASRIWEGWQGVRVGAARADVEGLMGPEDKKGEEYGCGVYFGSGSFYQAIICYDEEKVHTIQWEWWGND